MGGQKGGQLLITVIRVGSSAHCLLTPTKVRAARCARYNIAPSRALDPRGAARASFCRRAQHLLARSRFSNHLRARGVLGARRARVRQIVSPTKFRRAYAATESRRGLTSTPHLGIAAHAGTKTDRGVCPLSPQPTPSQKDVLTREQREVRREDRGAAALLKTLGKQVSAAQL